MIIGISRVRINKKGEGKIKIPLSIYYTIVSNFERRINVIT
jgi:hypothetical protein